MTPFKRNLSRLLFISLVVAIGTVASGIIYYLKMGQNEDTLNTLLFRELRQVEGSLQRSLEKIKKTTNYLLPQAKQRDIATSNGGDDSTDKTKVTINYSQETIRAIDKLGLSDDLTDIRLVSENHDAQACDAGKQHGFVFRFKTDQYNTGETVSQRSDGLTKNCIRLRFSLHHALMQSVNRFQTVALVDSDGIVKSMVSHEALLHKRHRLTDFSNETALYINEIVNFSKSNQDASGAIDIRGTQYIDARLSEQDFRLYIHPLTSEGLVSEAAHYYLVGFIQRSKITEQKLRLSPDLLMWLILGLLLLVACIPLIKLRFVSTTYAIQQSDKSQIILGLLLAVGILTIGINQQLFFGYFKDVKEAQLKDLHGQIRHDFREEIVQLLATAQHAKREIAYGAGQQAVWLPDSQNRRFRPQCQPQPQLSAYYNHAICDQDVLYNKRGPSALVGGFIESAFVFNNQGEILNDAPFLLATDKLAVDTRVDVTSRNYIKSALAGDFWQISAAAEPFYIERVFNIEDGRKNAFVSMPLGNHRPQPKIFIAVGTRFASLVDRVLPNNFGFTVIDANRKVLFHSDESLSMLENFYSESNYDRELQIASQRHQVAQPVTMDVIYKGDPHMMAVGPLVASQPASDARTFANVPWRLVVFYNPNLLQTNNMIMVFLAVFIYMLIIIPAFLLLRYLTYQRFWQELCYFDNTRTHLYAGLSVLTFTTCLFIQFQMGVLQTLSSRLLLWGITCLTLAIFLMHRYDIALNYYKKLRQPLTSFAIILGLFVLLFALTRQITVTEIISVNIAFSAMGVLLLLIVFIVCSRYLLASRPAVTRQQINAHESSRFTMGYLWFLVSLIYLGASVPAAMISHSANEYLLQRQAEFEQHSVKADIARHIEKREAYIDVLLSSPCRQRPSDPAICSYRDAMHTSLPEIFKRFYPQPGICPENEICWARVVLSARTNTTDDFFDAMFSLMAGNTDLVSHLTYAAKTDIINAADSDKTGEVPAPVEALQYRTDLLMLAASETGTGTFIIMLSLIALPLGVYIVTRTMVVQRMLGEHLHDQYRVLQNCHTASKTTQVFPQLDVTTSLAQGHSHLVLNATRLEAEKKLNQQSDALFEHKVHRITDCLDEHYALDQHTREFRIVAELNEALSASPDGNIIIGISAVEQVSLDAERRKRALALLYTLHMHPKILLVIIAETAPLYRLLMPASYETREASVEPDIDEKAAWSKLFSEFEKHYAWSPICKSRIANPFNIKALIEHECDGWPEMHSLRQKLIDFTQATNEISPRHPANSADVSDDYQSYWQPEQVIEFMLVHAGPLYRRKWEECTTREKLILWKIANGASVNPASAVVIEHLVRRCYLFRDKGWHLVNESFRQFILTAESNAVINQWIDESSTGAWSVLRIPIFALLLVLLVVFVYSSGSSLNTIVSVATATLGLIPLLIKNVSLLKAGAGTELE